MNFAHWITKPHEREAAHVARIAELEAEVKALRLDVMRWRLENGELRYRLEKKLGHKHHHPHHGYY